VLLSGIPWSIPIPTKDYSLIAGGGSMWGREYLSAIIHVKNHTFLRRIIYSLRVMVDF
jgi:hypothetical protein